MSQITNINELRLDLIQVYTDLRAGKIGIKDAKQTALLANTIVSSAKVQMNYNTLTKQSARIPFLEVND